MAESVVSFLLSKVSTLLSQEYTQLEGLQREVQYIKDELGSMRAFLRDAEAKQDAGLLDAVQQEWIKQVRDAAYDTEDVVDEFLLRFAHHRDAGFCGHVRHICTSLKNLRARHRISSKIRDIKYRVEQIPARHQRYHYIEGISETNSRCHASQHPIRGHALLLEEADLVGIDRPKSEIISIILNNQSCLKAISVVGMGGLGKTTLVRRVYEAPDVKRAFSIHAWLTISETFRIEDALKNLVQQLCKHVEQPIPGEVDSMDGDGLRAFVRGFLKDRRYIIVLDDLWRLDSWDSIKFALPDDNCSSCIVITTRIADVATTCCKEFRGNVHRMKPLSTEESWNLFCKRTFGEGSCPPYLKDISRTILSKCEGLPLGIVAISGLLALKDTSKPGEWEMVLRSLGGELEGSGKLEGVKKILLLSYNDLPYYLQSCLLYMGIFPEDTIVDTEELAFLWIAEGFIELRPGMTTMEVAQCYINELIGRSLIQVAQTTLDGRLESCRIHDLIYKIILSKCREHNILTEASTPYTTWPEKVRRLVVDDSTCPKEPVHLLYLRSLVKTRYRSCLPEYSSSLSKLLSGTPKLLKVLNLEGARLSTIPKEVFKLSSLTYLRLAYADVANIPKSIGKLQNLEYLLLESIQVMKLPADIIKLKKLCYLQVSGYFGFKAPYGLGGLFSLHYLETIKVDSVKVIQEIGKLTQLRKLGIRNFTRANGRELCSSLEKLTNLQELSIRTVISDQILDLQYPFSSTLHFLHTLYLQGRLIKVPDWVPSCHGLSILRLDYSCLREDQLESLAGLPNLVHLRLFRAYEGDRLHFQAGGFQKLKSLELNSLSGLKLVTLEKGTLSDLETLRIEKCPLLEELPRGIQYLRNLRSLRLQDNHTRLENNLRNLDKRSDGYQNIAHISEICIVSDCHNTGGWKWDYL